MKFLIPPVKAYSCNILNPFNYTFRWRNSWINYFNGYKAYGFGSCRSALCESLKALSKIDSRKKVIAAAFTCPTVIESIRNSGLEVVFCDLNESFEMSFENICNLVDDNTLGVVFSYLYGAKDQIIELITCLKEQNIYVIEDVSLALGLKNDLINYGAFGDITVASLGFGKTLSVGGGGVLVIRNKELANNNSFLVNERIKVFPSLLILVKLILYPLVLNKYIFKVLWYLGVRLNEGANAEVENGEFRWSYLQAFISGHMIEKLDELIKLDVQRINNNKFLSSSFYVNSDINFTRFPIKALNKVKRKKIVEELRANGYYASYSFFDMSDYIDDTCPISKKLTEFLLTIPCHTKVSRKDCETMEAIVKKHFL